MPKYRKRPVVVEAIKFIYSTEGIDALVEFCGCNLISISKARHMSAIGEALIRTLEDGKDNNGRHVATEGDFIIRGIKGEYYPCKPDIFDETYELVV